MISFIVTDIETDGHVPGTHSMISLASVAIGEDGASHGTFSINLKQLPDATTDRETMLWWHSQPLAWRAATVNQQDPKEGMRAWADWVESRLGDPVFAAHPLCFDGPWVDLYLQKFVGRRLFKHPRDSSLCMGSGVDIPSLIMGTTGWDYRHCNREHYPAEWLGGHAHSHFALDDALGYAHLLSLILTSSLPHTKR